jgi:hypothetical protein
MAPEAGAPRRDQGRPNGLGGGHVRAPQRVDSCAINGSRRSTLAQARDRIYIDWYGVKSWTGPSARFARNSALTSPRTSP